MTTWRVIGTIALTSPQMTASDNVWSVYLIHCADDTIYTGVSINVERRIQKHLANRGAKYLMPQCRRPFKRVVSTACESKSEALKKEIAIKALSHVEKLKIVHGWNTVVIP